MDETNSDNKSNLPSSLPSTHNPNQSSSSPSSTRIPNPITNQKDLFVAEMTGIPTPTFVYEIAQASSSSTTSTPFDDVQQQQQQQPRNPTTSNVVETMTKDSDSPSNACLQQQQQQQVENPDLFMTVEKAADGRLMIPYPYSRKHDAFVVRQRPGGPDTPYIKQLIPRPEMARMLAIEFPNMKPLLPPLKKRPCSSSLVLRFNTYSRTIKKKEPYVFTPYTYLRPRRRPRLASYDDPVFKVPPLPPPRPPASDDYGVVEFGYTILDDDDDDDDDWPDSDEDDDDDDDDDDDNNNDDGNNNAGSSIINISV